MRLSSGTHLLLRIGTGFTLAFIYVPLAIVFVYAFSEARTFEWPPPGFTLEWFEKATQNVGAREALWYSFKVGLLATGVAMILGTLASLAVARHRFFGRETISFLVILPIALPGIVTGIALNSTFTQVLGIPLSILTIVIAHATFCIVVVYNNAVARLRRMSSVVRGGFGRPGRDTLADVSHGDAAEHEKCACRRRPACLRAFV